jgi:hypothetical protein
LFLVLFVLCVSADESLAAKSAKKKGPETVSMPPYRTSGTIPGTSLIYKKLYVGDNGKVTVCIYNPGRSGVRFRANFSFYSAKNEYLTGFKMDGFAPALVEEAYSLSLPQYKKMRQVSYMTVMGRSGRVSGDDWEE